MSSKRAAVVGWTRGGRFEDFRSSVAFVLREWRIGGRMHDSGDTLTLDGPEPISVASALRGLPGVAWVAAGRSGRSLGEIAAEAGDLAKVYVRRESGFAVFAEGPTSRDASDLGGMLTSSILETVKGARVSTDSAEVVFRATFDGTSGAVGVEVAAGPGGIPTGNEGVACLVSGGLHSSVLAWFSVLQGLRVSLVHAEAGESGLRAVAGLYAELSHRADPRWLKVEILSGGTVLSSLSHYATRSKVPVYSGISRTGETRPSLPSKVTAPLYLMPQERFLSEFDRLGLRGSEDKADWNRPDARATSTRKFGGKRADLSEVLDSLAAA